ncbi:MAG: hypothetical protein HQ580_04820 [Planctomycetes bacterium]|nr:hypothetical protein [Planctomycetota bacterium]
MNEGRKTSVNGIVDIDVYRSTTLKNGKSQSIISKTFNRYHSLVDNTFGMFNGVSWHQMGDGGIYTFPTPVDAVDASLRLLDKLFEFNTKNKLCIPLFTRIGIHQIKEKDIESVQKDKRGIYANTALDIAGKLQKNCPIGKIAVSSAVYNKIGIKRNLFRPSLVELRGRNFFVLIDRPIMPHERELCFGLPDEQQKLIPPIPFPTWENIAPNENMNLIKLGDFFEKPVLVVLGETLSHPKSPISSAATSDAVGMMEVMAAIAANRQLRVGIDAWEDTADLVSDHNILIIGSGIVNVYAFVLNDILCPIHFVKTKGRIFDQIVATSNKGQLHFGHHSIPPRDCGLVLISKSPFNLENTLFWVAGITGIGTQAAAKFVWDLTQDSKQTLRKNFKGSLSDPIACVVGAHVPKGVWEISNYNKRWRISDYRILWAVDHSGNSVDLWEEQ